MPPRRGTNQGVAAIRSAAARRSRSVPMTSGWDSRPSHLSAGCIRGLGFALLPARQRTLFATDT